MLVSVLVGRYQRVFNRKRFFNDDYSEKMMFDDSLIRLKSQEKCNGTSIEIEKAFDHISKSDDDDHDDNNEKEGGDDRPGKVRFIVGYVSDEDSDNSPDETDGSGDKLINKVTNNC